MGRLDLTRFSDRFRVRRLSEDDLPELYHFSRTNPQYYEYCGADATEQTFFDDLRKSPPGKGPDDKYYVGFYDGQTLTAVLDLVDGYPVDTTAFIGFFMVRGSASGRGTGTQIIGCLCAYLKQTGLTALQLAYEKSNPQASHFWTKNGFACIRETDHQYGHLIVGERKL